MDIYQAAWVLLSAISTIWLISRSGPMLQAVSSWDYATMLVVATILSVAILFWVASCLAQILFYAA